MPKKKTKATKPKKRLRFTASARLQRVLGVVFLLISFALLVSFSSYLFTFDIDGSEVVQSDELILDANRQVDNALGRLGAVLGHFFMHKLFGLTAFSLIFLTFCYGVNFLFRKRLFSLTKVSLYTMLFIFLIAPLLAYLNLLISPHSGIIWGGGFGNYLMGANGVLIGLLGTIGAGALLSAVLFVSAILIFDLNLVLPNLKMLNRKDESNDQDEKPTSVAVGDTIFEKDGISEESIIDDTPSIIEPKNVTDDLVEDKPMESGAFEEVTNIIKSKRKSQAEEPEFSVEEVKEEKIMESKGDVGAYDPTLDLSSYKYPPLDLMEDHGSEKVSIDAEELEKNKNQIITTLNNYNIEIDKIKATIGPTVTLYEIVPAPGVRISKIKNLEDDIALSLAALGIRIIAPIPGKGTIGIEVPNEAKETVSMRALLSSEKYRNTKFNLPIVLGKTISNEIFMADLAKMPHLLMAGATGQGKSVGINAILMSLLYKKHPSQMKLVLVDPKKVELSIYNAIEKHFLAKLPGEEEPIITDTKKVVNTLNALCIEMDERYELLKSAKARNLNEYNAKFVQRKLNPEKGHKYMPLIVVVVDEFADLIMTAGKEVEIPIARLAQLARAIGIHLILATQRPSVNIITGTIKANFPARISYKVTSKVDSRTILDVGGAEQLIGRGDMLLSMGSDMVRIQCGFCDTPEVEKVVDFIEEQLGYEDAYMLPEFVGDDEAGSSKGGYNANERDPLFEDAARVVVQNQMGSTSMIQRRLKLGYNRAGRLMDQLEDAGIVGPNVGSKAREVYYQTEVDLEQYLQSLKEIG